MELLSFNGLCQIVGISRITAKNWVDEFSMYIPKTEQQDGMYYLPEAIDMLRFIKKCKYQNECKNKIRWMLAQRSFPIRVENTMENIQVTVDQEEYRDNMLTVMQTIGATVSNVATQQDRIESIQEQQGKHKKQIKNIEKQAKEIDQLKQELEAFKQQVATENEYELSKYKFAKLFE
jgi:DNA-binding transcriptional MerR regulator